MRFLNRKVLTVTLIDMKQDQVRSNPEGGELRGWDKGRQIDPTRRTGDFDGLLDPTRPFGELVGESGPTRCFAVRDPLSLALSKLSRRLIV